MQEQRKLKKLLLFDAETQHYRQSIYRFFHEELKKMGYELHVIYDRRLNEIEGEIFTGLDYNLNNFNRIIKENDCELIILFVWLRYRFLLPFMLKNRFKGIKMITWSHGINLQNKKNHLKNQLYYMRQRLAHSLIIFSEEEKRYIKASHRKLFIANNTLNFNEFPNIDASPKSLKQKYKLEDKKVILSVGRWNTNNRKVSYLIQGMDLLKGTDKHLVVVGPGVPQEDIEEMEKRQNITHLGPIFDPVKMNEIYKLADLFCMPGAIGLAINHAFYYGVPVIIERVDHGPEAYFLKEGENGYFFEKGNIEDMVKQISTILDNPETLKNFSAHARDIIRKEGSIENMLEGFKLAIQYIEKKYGNDKSQ